jgi:peptidoglycan/xylan/chitin deacetylase (PgdA/CDA1 family)
MTRNQLRILARNSLFKVGAHTVTHPMLANLSVGEQREEIEGSKKALEGVLESPVDAFSCPHGSYSEETVALFESAGLRVACTSRHGVVNVHTDVLQLPRIVVKNWDGEEFGRHLADWTH